MSVYGMGLRVGDGWRCGVYPCTLVPCIVLCAGVVYGCCVWVVLCVR